jgi:tripartite-type tricarboxylate transporter receptor subunit TctC
MRSLLCGLLAAAAACGLTPAAAQPAYPTKPIRLIIPFPAGSTADAIARVLEPTLTERLRQPVVLEHRPGEAGNAGIAVVAKSAPDGYTIGLGDSGTLAANASLYPKMPYHPVTDLAPVANVAFVPFLLVANPKVPVSTLPELVELARAKPAELLLGFGAKGSASHLAAELFKLLAQVQMVNVPYKDTALAAADAVNGKLPLAMVDVGSALGPLKTAKLKAIAASGARRAAGAPQVPTIAESGLANFEATGWFGLVAAAATPPQIVARLNTDVVAALQRAEVRDRILAAGAEPAPGTPAEFGALIRAETDKWAQVVKATGARAD